MKITEDVKPSEQVVELQMELQGVVKILEEILKPLKGEDMEDAYLRQRPQHAEPDHAAYAAKLDKIVNGVDGIVRWSKEPGLSFLSSAVLIGEQLAATVSRQDRFPLPARSCYRIACWHHVAYLAGLRMALLAQRDARLHDVSKVSLMDHAFKTAPRFTGTLSPTAGVRTYDELVAVMSAGGLTEDEQRLLATLSLVSLDRSGAAALAATSQLGAYFDKRAAQTFVKAQARAVHFAAHGFACSLSAFRQLALHDVPLAVHGKELGSLPEFEYPPALGVSDELN